MLKKMMVVLATVAVAVTFAACSSVEFGTTLNGQKLTDVDTVQSMGHVNGDIWGIYFFTLPLFSGSSSQPGRCAIFKNTVTTDNVVDMITEQSRIRLESTKVLDITTNRSNVWFLLFNYNAIQASGNGVR